MLWSQELHACWSLLQASYGVNLIRFFGNINGVGNPAGYGYTNTTDRSILVSIDPVTLEGKYNETSFKRFDLVLAEACKCPAPKPHALPWEECQLAAP